jgi:hypothetical protein
MADDDPRNRMPSFVQCRIESTQAIMAAKASASPKRKHDGPAGLEYGEDVNGHHKKAHTTGDEESEIDSDDELDQILGDLNGYRRKAHTAGDEESKVDSEDELDLSLGDLTDLDDTKPCKRGWYGKQSGTSATPSLTDKTKVERPAGPRTEPIPNRDSDHAAGETKKTEALPAAVPSTEMVLHNANVHPGSGATPQAPWYRLPYELHYHILEYVLNLSVPIYPPNCYIHNQRMILRAGLVCRDMNKIATEIFYKQNSFMAKVARPWVRAEDTIFQKCFMSPNASVGPMVRRLKIELCVDSMATTVQDMVLGRIVDEKYRKPAFEWRHLLGWEGKIAEEAALKMEHDRRGTREKWIANSKYEGFGWGKGSDNPRKYWDHGCTRWQETLKNLTSLSVLLRAEHSEGCARCHPNANPAVNGKHGASFPQQLEDGIIALRAHQVNVIVEGVECNPECGEFARSVERTIRAMIQAPEPEKESKG